MTPSKLPPIASQFISAIADRFQERHVPALSRDRAICMAVTTLEWVEADCGPFGHPDFAWDAAAARAAADEEIENWETMR